MFDDEEARKAILDLRARIQASDENAQAKLADQARAQAALLEQVGALRRSLLELNAQLEAQRADNARLRGTQEQLARDLADLQKLTRDMAKSLDDRLRNLEPQKVTLDGKEFSAEPDERRAHDAAMAALRGGDFDKAAGALGAFVQRYPNSGYNDSVRFWLGNALYGQKNYKEAISVFRAMVTAAPNHPRTPEALLAVANCQIEMKDTRGARKTLDDLIKAHPASEAAAAGKERLGTLKG
ncbi:tol-pal system protein YbgF [Rubrivivax pictus]|uniref:Cell division coordinator CpoB n=1 Tax=Pseudaquabacterium pictum TaxID=2315236 RepID=A0A480AJ52_9BURK|nr:tol-pal system protein YbgF [Rubrivivax pictus]GCL61769.1 tol-pal system protein YbgF [Rubrivivax pictus]